LFWVICTYQSVRVKFQHHSSACSFPTGCSMSCARGTWVRRWSYGAKYSNWRHHFIASPGTLTMIRTHTQKHVFSKSGSSGSELYMVTSFYRGVVRNLSSELDENFVSIFLSPVTRIKVQFLMKTMVFIISIRYVSFHVVFYCFAGNMRLTLRYVSFGTFLQGSITGAYSSRSEKITPSFILLAVQDAKVVCYVYELINGEVEVSKTEFVKTVVSDRVATNSTLLDTLLK
jgi:hypothetical protein